AGRSRDERDVGDPELVRCRRRKVAIDQVRRGPSVLVAPGRHDRATASADAHDPGCTHQPGNALASMLLPCGPHLGMYAGDAVSLVRRHVDGPDPLHMPLVTDSTSSSLAT